MLASDIRLISAGTQCELQAQVKSDVARKRFLLRYVFPRQVESFLTPENGDPFLAGLLLPAMITGESLEIRAPVSSKLLHSVHELQTIYRSWSPKFSVVQVRADVRKIQQPEINRGRGTGLFFSCGVDSYYSLLTRTGKRLQDEEAITDLIVGYGQDLLYEKRNSNVFSKLLMNANNVAKRLGLRTLPVATNLRDFSDRYTEFKWSHGAALASIGLTLETLFKKIYIASSSNYAKLVPWGSHPKLDPLWSTECLSFVHDISDTNRLDKIRFVSRFPLVQETLRVCSIHSYSPRFYNCGSCEKCVRTMIALWISGALSKCTTLPHYIDLALVLNHNFYREDCEEFFNALGSSREELAIRSALEESISTATRSKVKRHLFQAMNDQVLVYFPFLVAARDKMLRAFTKRKYPLMVPA